MISGTSNGYQVSRAGMSDGTQVLPLAVQDETSTVLKRFDCQDDHEKSRRSSGMVSVTFLKQRTWTQQAPSQSQVSAHYDILKGRNNNGAIGVFYRKDSQGITWLLTCDPNSSI